MIYFLLQLIQLEIWWDETRQTHVIGPRGHDKEI